MWQDICTAPVNEFLAIAVIETEVHPAFFPCILTAEGWLNAETMKKLELSPTHWRKWPAVTYFGCCG